MMDVSDRRTHRRAIALLCFCSLCWSIAGVFTRHLEQAQGFEITFWRSLFCAVGVLLALAWQQRGNPLRPVVAMGLPGLLAGAMWGVMFTCFMLAVTRTSVANTLLVTSLTPLIAAPLGWLVLREQVAPRTWLAILAALGGIWWMVRDGISAEGLSGMLIALGVPTAAAINIVLLRRMHAQVDLAPAALIGAGLSCLATLPLALPFQANLNDIAILALLGFVQLALPCMLFVRAAKHLSAQEMGLIALLEVVLGPLWAWLFAGEAMGAATVQGGLMVLAALAVNELAGRRWPTPRPA